MRLIDADALKQTFCAECGGTIVCDDCDIDYHFSHAPTLEPKYVGQWIRYDGVVEILKAQQFDLLQDGRRDAADALQEMAKYFELISRMCPKEDGDE